MTKFEFLKKIYWAFWENFEGRNYSFTIRNYLLKQTLFFK